MQRKDNYLHGVDSAATPPHPGTIHREQSHARFQAVHGHPLGQNGNPSINGGPYLPPPLEIPAVPVRSALPGLAMSSHGRSTSSTPIGDQFRSPQSYHSPTSSAYSSMAHLNRANSDSQYYRESATSGGHNSPNSVRGAPHATIDANQRHSSFGSINSVRFQNPMGTSPQDIRSTAQPTTSPTHYRAGPTSYAPSPPHNYPANLTSSNGVYIPQYQFPPLQSLPPAQFPVGGQQNYSTSAGALDPQEAPQDTGIPANDAMDSPIGDSAPIFGGEGYARSPLAMADDFAVWLFSDPHYAHDPLDSRRRGSLSIGPSAYMEIAGHTSTNGHQLPTIPQQHPMAVTSILDPLPQTVLSEDKRQQLLEIIKHRFNERHHLQIRKQKDDLLEGDNHMDSHVLSLLMMKTYIGSYWYHFHPQMPILHKPTFSADKAQDLLLIAVIAIGAACLDKIYGQAVTKAAADLSNFLAWHLRGELFMDADFRPPAKLWVFQTLLLLEVYEKMYSTRVLHERAHIHHATTLTLMRRGSSLRGRSALDSPPSVKEDRLGISIIESPHAVADTPDQWWNYWITNEATRRVAFAAFIIDSTHATMFGHSVTMVAHEMRLPLPCDEALWSATSSTEVGRIETNLQAAGIKPITFLDGLKWTLGGKSVRTNSFGRSALMAGLLSVSWHMHQRDMQVSSLGVINSLGGKVIWRGSLTKAFDYWERDFDSAVTKEDKGYPSNSHNSPPGKLDEENIFESRTVLHHLAHMAMHVDIVKCQIFAKAHRLLGRTITPSDYNSASRYIREVWAPKATARDATFFALRFLSQVLAPDLSGTSQRTELVGMGGLMEYSARDDFLLNRPWVLYFAALVVWSYGYALDGVIKNPPALTTPEQQNYDMRQYLKRVGGVREPTDLATLRDRNACIGMLMLMKDMFRKCRWELMHEAANLLNNCIELLKGSL